MAMYKHEDEKSTINIAEKTFASKFYHNTETSLPLLMTTILCFAKEWYPIIVEGMCLATSYLTFSIQSNLFLYLFVERPTNISVLCLL